MLPNENILVSNENICYRMKIFQYRILLLFGNHRTGYSQNFTWVNDS